MFSIIIIQIFNFFFNSNLIKKIHPIKTCCSRFDVNVKMCKKKKCFRSWCQIWRKMSFKKKKNKQIKWNHRSTAEGKLTANYNVHFVLFVTQSYRTHLVNFVIVFLMKIAESTYMVHLWTSAALILLNGKEQHKHCSEYHLLCSTEESQSYRLILFE